MNPLPRETTVGNLYGPAMRLDDPAEAAAYLDALVERRVRVYHVSEQEARRIEQENILHWAFVCGYETRKRVMRVFGLEGA